MRKRIALVICALACAPLALASCSATAPARDYVEADLENFNSIAPVVRALADDDPTNDPDLSGANGRALLLQIDTWKARIDTALTNLGAR